MANLTNALQELRAELNRAQLHVEKLGQAISVNVPKPEPTKASHIRSFTPENGTGSESAMGEGWEGSKAGSGKNKSLGSEAHHVGISAQKDRSGPKSEMGEDTRGAKEGSLT
jgi:hypothetical protein